MPKALPFPLRDYFELVNWTGQAVREDKRGTIPEGLPPILERLRTGSAAWLRLATELESSFCTWIGQADRVHETYQRLGYQRARGIGACRRLFAPKLDQDHTLQHALIRAGGTGPEESLWPATGQIGGYFADSPVWNSPSH